MSLGPDGGIIRVFRMRRGGLRDRFRSYQVMIDGERTALIKRGQQIDVLVTPGRHTVSLRAFLNMYTLYSPELEVDLAPGQGASLICEPTIFPPLGPGCSISLQRIR